MGGFLSGVLGTDSQYQATPYQAGNPYNPNVLQTELDNRQQLYADQQALAQQLQAQMAGRGPNPAQTQYLQNVQSNNAQAQGLIASQRGLNPALAVRMGANAASAANQQAAMQSGLMQQQQQLGATQGLGNLYGQMQQGNLAQQQLYVAPNTSAMQTNAAVANANQQSAQGIVGGLLGAIGGAATTMKAHGGMIQGFADGGAVDPMPSFDPNGPQSFAGKFFNGFGSGLQMPQSSTSPVLTAGFGANGAMGANPMLGTGVGKLAGAGKKAVMNAVAPGSGLMAGGPMDAMGPAVQTAPMVVANQGGKIPMNFMPGGPVPGEARVSGDSLQNDTVPAMVSPGEIVLPRSVTQAKNAPEKAAAFVEAILAKQSMRGKK